MSKKLMRLLALIFFLALLFHPLTGPSPAFENVLDNSGIQKRGRSTGVSWSDFDNDGDLDLLILGGEDGTKLYQNNKNQFVDITKTSGINTSTFAQAGVFADFNNDGCLDLYISNSGTEPQGESDLLYRGNCDGSFTDVTKEAGIANPNYSRGVAWADFDNDGYLDIYIANQGFNGGDRYVFEPNVLYQNNRDGTFTDVAADAGVIGMADCPGIPNVYEGLTEGGPIKWAFQPLWFDYNDDRKPDLFVATDYGISPLYRNNGDGTFTDVTQEAGLCRIGSGMGVTAGDYDNDGDLDLYVTNVGANFLLENNGDGTFAERAAEVMIANHLSLGWATEFFDYDNDGNLDLYVVNGIVAEDVEQNKIRQDKLYKNTANGAFTDVTDKEGIYGNEAKEAGAFADFNNDGFQDFIVISSSLEDKASHRLYKNKGNKNNWLTIEIVGKRSNRNGVGAKIVLETKNDRQMREVFAGSSYISQSSLWPTFGLGKTKVVRRIEVTWPSGAKQVLKNVKVNQKIVIEEQK